MPQWQVAVITISAVFGFAGLCAILGLIYVNYFSWKAAYHGYAQFDMEENRRRNVIDRENFERTGGSMVRPKEKKQRDKGDRDSRYDSDEGW